MIEQSKYTYWDDNMPGRPTELNFIKQVSLPIADFEKDAKMTVRTFPLPGNKPWAVIHPSVPNREQVWKRNFERRTDQTRQGFNSRIDKPYVGLWDPVYLDSKKLLTTRLGLKEEKDALLVSEEDMKNVDNQVVQPTGPTKYVPKRSKKDLNSLKKEITGGRQLIRNVQLGHDLFKLLQRQYAAMKNRKESDAERIRRSAKETWQVPKVPGTGESDSDGEEEADLSRFLISLDEISPVPESALSRQYSIRPESQGHLLEGRRPMTAAMAPGSQPQRAQSAPAVRKKRGVARPYTPKETNISLKAKHQEDFEWYSLFCQLCALYWILEAMDIPESSKMSPITTCWEIHKAIGGEEIKNRKDFEAREKRLDHEFDNIGKPPKPKNQSFGMRRRASDRRMENRIPFRGGKGRAGSLTASLVSSTPCGSQLDLTEPDYVREAEVMTSMLEEAESTASDLEDHQEQHYPRPRENPPLTKESSVRQEAVTPTPRPATVGEVGGGSRGKQVEEDSPVKRDKEMQKKMKLEQKQLRASKKREEIAKWEDQPIERLSQYKQYRVGAFVPPRPTKELFDFKSNCQSVKKRGMTDESRQKWSEVQAEASIKLHDSLEYHLRQRMKTCKSKFLVLNPGGNSFHRTLTNMRMKSEQLKREEEEKLTKAVDKSRYAQWYHYLLDLIPAELTDIWQIKDILDKLQKFGLRFSEDDQTEVFRQNSERKFVKVLSELRDWELCSPHIAAAIEFCREHILEMCVEDFEEFVQVEFPSVERPKTALPRPQAKLR